MPEEIRLWQVGEQDQLREISASKLDLEDRLETWLAHDISVLSPDLLVIGRQVNTAFGGCIDLLCINSAGDLVIVELKRDKTPREITAQVLDYASWVSDLSHDRIREIAAEHMQGSTALEERFFRAFGTELPATLNSEHGMIVVGSAIDGSTERIIEYLSNVHGVNINAATFRFYDDERVGELLGRVFLLEPETVERKVYSKGSSKRKPNRTYEELKEAAEKRGVGEVYDAAFSRLNGFFTRGTTRTTTGFAGQLNGSRSIMFNLLPFDSDREKGLHFQAYTVRLGMLLGVERQDVEAHLPDPLKPWAYANTQDEFWHGCTGYFRAVAEIEMFTEFIRDRLNRNG